MELLLASFYLDPESGKGGGKGEIKVRARGLEFKIKRASYETCKVEYDKNVDDFLEHRRANLPPLNTWNRPSQPLLPGNSLSVLVHEI